MLENSALVWHIVITERETVEAATLIVMTVTYKLPSTIAIVGGYFFFPLRTAFGSMVPYMSTTSHSMCNYN